MKDFRRVRAKVADKYGEVVNVGRDDAVANVGRENHKVCVNDVCGARMAQ